MIYIEDTIVEIEAGTVDDRTAQEVYRNLQVLYGTETGEQACPSLVGIGNGIAAFGIPKREMQQFYLRPDKAGCLHQIDMCPAVNPASGHIHIGVQFRLHVA